MKRVDFHLHTLESDGLHNFREVLTFLRDAEVTDFAITDHDTVLSTRKYEAYAKKYNMRLITGTEISTTGKDLGLPDMHILGYGMTEIGQMEKVFDAEKESNEQICQQVIALLQQQGFDFTIFDVRLAQAGRFLTKRDLARYMVSQGFAKNNKEVYDVFIGRGTKAYIPINKLSVQYAIELIRSSGGHAVLAHPGKLPKECDIADVLEKLKGVGLEGIEAVTPRHTERDVRLYHSLAKKFDLVETCGSDFHRITTDPCPGLEMDEEFLKPFYDLLGI